MRLLIGIFLSFFFHTHFAFADSEDVAFLSENDIKSFETSYVDFAKGADSEELKDKKNKLIVTMVEYLELIGVSHKDIMYLVEVVTPMSAHEAAEVFKPFIESHNEIMRAPKARTRIRTKQRPPGILEQIGLGLEYLIFGDSDRIRERARSCFD